MRDPILGGIKIGNPFEQGIDSCRVVNRFAWQDEIYWVLGCTPSGISQQRGKRAFSSLFLHFIPCKIIYLQTNPIISNIWKMVTIGWHSIPAAPSGMRVSGSAQYLPILNEPFSSWLYILTRAFIKHTFSYSFSKFSNLPNLFPLHLLESTVKRNYQRVTILEALDWTKIHLFIPKGGCHGPKIIFEGGDINDQKIIDHNFDRHVFGRMFNNETVECNNR